GCYKSFCQSTAVLPLSLSLSLSLSHTHTHAHTHTHTHTHTVCLLQYGLWDMMWKGVVVIGHLDISLSHSLTLSPSLSLFETEIKLYWHHHNVLKYCQSIWVGCTHCIHNINQKGKGEMETI